MRGVLGDAELRRRVARTVVFATLTSSIVAGVGDERFERSPSEWAERAPRLIGHRAEQERVPTLSGGRRSWRDRSGGGGRRFAEALDDCPERYALLRAEADARDAGLAAGRSPTRWSARSLGAADLQHLDRLRDGHERWQVLQHDPYLLDVEIQQDDNPRAMCYGCQAQRDAVGVRMVRSRKKTNEPAGAADVDTGSTSTRSSRTT